MERVDLAKFSDRKRCHLSFKHPLRSRQIASTYDRGTRSATRSLLTVLHQLCLILTAGPHGGKRLIAKDMQLIVKYVEDKLQIRHNETAEFIVESLLLHRTPVTLCAMSKLMPGPNYVA